MLLNLMPNQPALPPRTPPPPAPGRGSVLTLQGRHELEASVMTNDKRCGAAALLTRGA